MLILDEFVQVDKSDAVFLACFFYFQKLTLLLEFMLSAFLLSAEFLIKKNRIFATFIAFQKN